MSESSNKINLFEGRPIRHEWDEQNEKWLFSVVDVIAILTDQQTHDGARKYWSVMKTRLKKEGVQPTAICSQSETRNRWGIEMALYLDWIAGLGYDICGTAREMNMAYIPIDIDRKALTIMGVSFSNSESLEITASSIGSNMFEGFVPTPQSVELLRDFVEGKISRDVLRFRIRERFQ